MIAIASSTPIERSALAGLLESRGWAALECQSARAAIRTLQRHRPRVVVTRHRLADGFSDDLIAIARGGDPASGPRMIVLLEAGEVSAVEVRQVALGADCVLRDPIRMDVLCAFIAQYLKAKPSPFTQPVASSGATDLPFCGGTFSPLDRTLRNAARVVALSPREAVLVDILTQSPGSVASYERLYSEILGRRFRGDTSNMRVLLGKLAASCSIIGLSIRRHLEVIPKTGYRYSESPLS